MSKHPKPNALIWLVLSVLVIALDQWSKAWVLRELAAEHPDWVMLYQYRNTPRSR